MMSSSISQITGAVKHWYLYVIMGVLFILCGFYVFQVPVESLVTLAVIFSFLFVLLGLFEIFYAIGNAKTVHGWGWILFMGIIFLFIGVYLLYHSAEIQVEFLILFTGFGLMFRSISAMAISFSMGKDWFLLFLLSILGLILSFIIIAYPELGGMSVVIWLGIGLIVLGIYQIMQGFKLKKLKA